MLAAKRERKAEAVAKRYVELAESGTGVVAAADVEVVEWGFDGNGVGLGVEVEGRLGWVLDVLGGNTDCLILACPGDVGVRGRRDCRHSKCPVDEENSRHGQVHETCMADEKGHL